MKRFAFGVAICGAIIWAYTTTGHQPVQTSPAIISPQTVILQKPQETAPPPTPIPTTSEAPTTTQAPIVTTAAPGVGIVDPETPCQEWLPLAVQVGWPQDRQVLEKLLAVMYRESRCQPDADSGPDHGLMQINRIHTAWLASGWGWTHDDMFDARKNLTFALALWQGSGWKPWRFSGGA